jgi:hypothetical protein
VGRFSTRFRPPPVRISRAQATSQQRILLSDVTRTSRGAGDYGSREARMGSVALELRVQKGTGPTTAGAMPIGRTRRKRGYPPIPVATASLEEQ